MDANKATNVAASPHAIRRLLDLSGSISKRQIPKHPEHQLTRQTNPMAGRIYALNGPSGLIPMEEAPYDSEKLLQELLASYPDLLAGEQIDIANPRRWLLVVREMAVPGDEDGNARWSLDHLFLDQDAIPTLVEVKRSTDSRIRRKVVGQMLDYAANAVVYWPVEEIRARFESRCEKRQRSR